jgi:hypothetical protein
LERSGAARLLGFLKQLKQQCFKFLAYLFPKTFNTMERNFYFLKCLSQYFGQFFNGPVSLTEEALPFLTDFLKLSAELKP